MGKVNMEDIILIVIRIKKILLVYFLIKSNFTPIIYQVENLFTQVGEATLQAMLVEGVIDFVSKSILIKNKPKNIENKIFIIRNKICNKKKIINL
jgi:hypothetical protein